MVAPDPAKDGGSSEIPSVPCACDAFERWGLVLDSGATGPRLVVMMPPVGADEDARPFEPDVILYDVLPAELAVGSRFGGHALAKVSTDYPVFRVTHPPKVSHSGSHGNGRDGRPSDGHGRQHGRSTGRCCLFTDAFAAPPWGCRPPRRTLRWPKTTGGSSVCCSVLARLPSAFAFAGLRVLHAADDSLELALGIRAVRISPARGTSFVCAQARSASDVMRSKKAQTRRHPLLRAMPNGAGELFVAFGVGLFVLFLLQWMMHRAAPSYALRHQHGLLRCHAAGVNGVEQRWRTACPAAAQKQLRNEVQRGRPAALYREGTAWVVVAGATLTVQEATADSSAPAMVLYYTADARPGGVVRLPSEHDDGILLRSDDSP